MSKYYLEKEDYYWSKVLVDGVILLVAFLIINYVKNGKFSVHPDYVKFMPYLFISWFISTIFSQKFMITENRNQLGEAKSYIFSVLVLVVIVTLILYISGWYYYSRLIIYGTISLFLILEIFILLILRLSDVSKEQKNKHEFRSIFFGIFEFCLLNGAFFLIFFIKRNTIHLSTEYRFLLIGLIFIWLSVSLFTHSFNISRKENYFKSVSPFILAGIILIGVVSFIAFFFNLSGYSRFIVLGSLGTYSLIEILIVTIFYFYSSPQVTDEPGVSGFRVGVSGAEIADLEDKPALTKYEVPDTTIGTLSIKEKLEKVFLKKHGEFREFLENAIDLDKIDSLDALVFYTANPFNIETLDDNSLNLLMNLRQINDFRRINQYFICVNSKLKQGGVFVSKFESIEQRKNKIYGSYPRIIAQSIYFFDFFYKRICPKLPFFVKIYFAVSKGRHRIISTTESLGRLHFCGFEIIALKECDDFTFFIAKKMRTPLFEEIPSYGILFKQKRVGKDGRFIYIFKLRTMHPFAEYLHKYIYDSNKLGKRGKIQEDYRITSWGRFFRKFWIDEIPMLINWSKGEVKLFGVRPLSETFFQTYPEDLKKERIKYKPGLIPPYYADLPHSIEEVWESERRYLNKYRIHPMRTDLVYLLKALKNILFHHAKSM